MQNLDQAISNATKAESTLSADQQNLDNLTAAAAQAAAPLPGAQKKVEDDITDFDNAMDALSAAALDAKIRKTTPPPVPVADPAPLPVASE